MVFSKAKFKCIDTALLVKIYVAVSSPSWNFEKNIHEHTNPMCSGIRSAVLLEYASE